MLVTSLEGETARAVARAVRTIGHEPGLQETLDAIASVARSSVPGFDHAGISILHKDGSAETMAASDPLVLELDRLQYELGEGPCLSALHETPVVLVPRATAEERWPRYLKAATSLGLRAQLAVRLFTDERQTMGGLNLYSTSESSIDPDAETIADLFAAHAAIALQQARQVDSLNRALETRKIIGQAIGMTMERYHLDEDRAFAFLLRASSHSNVKLRDLAASLVADANGRPVDPR
jgi:GAF domain-containing protein